MSDGEPIVCRVFKLPPEQETFFTLKSLLGEILQKLDQLNLAIVAYSKTHPHPEAIQLLHDTRAAAATGAKTVHSAVFILTDIAKFYLRLMNNLDSTSSGGESIEIRFITDHVDMVAQDCEKGRNQFKQFAQDTTDTVGKISALLENDKSGENILYTQQNAQVVNDLLRAANETASLLQDSDQYCKALKQHLLEVVGTSQATPASTTETNAVRQRWSHFRDNIANVESETSRLRVFLDREPRMYTEETVPLGMTVEVAGTAPASADPKSSSGPFRSHLKRIRSSWKRLFSSITFHYFDK